MGNIIKSIVLTVIPLIADIVTILGWAGVNADGMEAQAYNTLHAAYPFIVAALSFLAGWFGHSAVSGIRDRISRQEAREKAEADRRYSELQNSIRMLDPDTKALFKVIGTGKTAYGNTSDWSFHPGLTEPFLAQFIIVEHIDRGRTKITATDLLKALVEEDPALFSSISGTVETHRRDSQPAGHISRSYNGEALPFWWWVGRA